MHNVSILHRFPMSDDDKLALPKCLNVGAGNQREPYCTAAVLKLIQEHIPSSMRCTNETRDLIISCCTGTPPTQTNYD